MTKAEKTQLLEELVAKFSESKYFYLTDFSTLNAEETTNLRRLCYEKDVEMVVLKNKLIKKALSSISEHEYQELYDYLAGPTAVMFCETGKVPAQLLKEYHKTSKKLTFKAAYVDSAVLAGEDKIDYLTTLKSKEDTIAELIGLLQSPMSNLMGALSSGGTTIHGLLKTLGERES
jgi:large subunit ribosomal protein L10